MAVSVVSLNQVASVSQARPDRIHLGDPAVLLRIQVQQVDRAERPILNRLLKPFDRWPEVELHAIRETVFEPSERDRYVDVDRRPRGAQTLSKVDADILQTGVRMQRQQTRVAARHSDLGKAIAFLCQPVKSTPFRLHRWREVGFVKVFLHVRIAHVSIDRDWLACLFQPVRNRLIQT
ncbi:hypothetical protein [Ruegeria arenilitoris]|uniref:hypothetical protein n=1 Tax=Ruegeria arenilitoris TaxID=1173585 RepID=UPI00147E518A|nr:hypothetical protein [Ruegeria arenilitoris]